MSAKKVSSEIQFMDEEKRELCEKIKRFISSDEGCCDRILSNLEDCGFYFIEQFDKKVLKFLVEVEENLLAGTLENFLIDYGIERGLIDYSTRVLN